MNITPIPLLTPTVSGDCYEPVILTRNKVVAEATGKKKKKKSMKRYKKEHTKPEMLLWLINSQIGKYNLQD